MMRIWMTKALKFWGTRGSCSVSGPEYSHFGGNTCCLELRYDDTLLIFDAGTGIRPLGLTLQDTTEINLFLSHMHWDHLIGFPFFSPIYNPKAKITIWAPETEGRTTRELFDEVLGQEFFPIHLDQIQAEISFQTIQANQPVTLGPITLNFHPVCHPGGALCFSLQTPHQKIGYVTDNEVKQDHLQSFIDFHKGSDFLIHEAQYTPEEYSQKAGWGHSNIERVIELVQKIHPGKWYVTHHDPKHTDDELRALEKMALAKELPCPVEWVKDGQTLILQ